MFIILADFHNFAGNGKDIKSKSMQKGNVREKVFFLESSNNFQFTARSYYPNNIAPKAIVQIIHGMAEHMGRYEEFARYLASNGFAVYLHDHPGHGEAAAAENRLGIIPNRRGWLVMLENTRTLYTHIRRNKPEMPLFLFGHSMGTVLARHFLAVYPVYLKGLILSSPVDASPWLMKISRLILTTLCRIQGPQKKNRWFNKLFYHNFNRHFNPRPTPYEWISSSREETDAYTADELCGFDCSNAFYNNLFKGMAAMKKSQQNLKYRKTLPLLIFSGQQDPAGNFGKIAIRIHQDFYQQRFQNLTVKIFDGRHEQLHEKHKEQVFFFMEDWMNECLLKKKIML
jgi:alpha-beta hydrolase superfamily lysophospholipase